MVFNCEVMQILILKGKTKYMSLFISVSNKLKQAHLLLVLPESVCVLVVVTQK